MKIEVGKYYKNRVGGVVAVTQFDKSNDGWPFVGSDNMTYNIDGAWRNLDYGDKEDLIEECNADGSPIVPVEDHLGTASWETTFDSQRRQEIALQLLPTIYTEFQRDVRERGCPNDWRTGICMDAFLLADEFIKVAKQS